jgi:Uma2 family endonuclease
MPVSEHTYLQLVWEDPDGQWELHCGRLWSKACEPMTWEHTDAFSYLGFLLQSQLSRDQFIVHWNAGRARRSEQHYYIPDLIVVPAELADRLFAEEGRLEVYSEPLPLVVEVWSPSTGRLDVREKLPGYRRRGDREIWLLHPYERTLTAWVWQADGSYAETVHRGGIVHAAALPSVSIDLDALFQTLRRGPRS